MEDRGATKLLKLGVTVKWADSKLHAEPSALCDEPNLVAARQNCRVSQACSKQDDGCFTNGCIAQQGTPSFQDLQCGRGLQMMLKHPINCLNSDTSRQPTQAAGNIRSCVNSD